MQKVAALIVALTASAAAYKVQIKNNCETEAYIWSCGDKIGDMQTLQPGEEPWSEEFYSKQGGAAGPSIYVSKTNSYMEGAITQLEYYFDGKIVWWDLSNINGNPYGKDGVILKSSLENPPYKACEPVTCPPSAGPCNMAYNTHEQLLGTHDCPGSDLIMELCPGAHTYTQSPKPDSDKGEDHSETASAPAPASSSSPLPPAETQPATFSAVYVPTISSTPVPVQQPEQGKPIIHTVVQVVTKVVKVPAPAPTDYEKRDSHAHARAHKGRNAKRGLGRRHNHQ
jgi:hypothetical protein